jgi:hypothetical protein
MSHNSDIEKLSKDAGAVEMKEVITHDTTKENIDPVLTDEEKKILKRATLVQHGCRLSYH